MDLTLIVDDEVVVRASRRAEMMGKTVEQMVREYLEELGGTNNRDAAAAEFRRISEMTQGDSGNWKFNREEIHERK